MFQGFYCATSAMLTQTRDLNVISNNMSNVSTPGYKRDKFIAVSFEEEMVYRSQNKGQVNAVQVGELGRGITADRNYTDYTQGGIQMTQSALDFALLENGFFTIASDEGTVYTRNGSFSLDEQGFLTLQSVGNVLSTTGQPIFIGNDNITADAAGNLFNEDTGEFLGALGIADFADYENELIKDNGVYVATGAPLQIEGTIMHKAYETSNADPVVQMTDMMASQRALQSSSQILKMYDDMMGKIVNDLSPV